MGEPHCGQGQLGLGNGAAATVGRGVEAQVSKRAQTGQRVAQWRLERNP